MNKISHKMYMALTRGGVPAETARRISEATEYLGDSTDESNERDNYDIVLAAKAISSLVRRHKDITPIMPKMSEEISGDMTRIGESVKSSDSPKPLVDSPIRKKVKLVDMVKKKSQSFQKAMSYIVPVAAYVLMALMFAANIVLAVASVAAIVAITVAGIVFFIIGLLYGVSQFSVFSGAAFFEIGIGLVGGGLAVLLSVLIFNFLTRTLPFCRKAGNLALKKLIYDFIALGNDIKKRK